MCVYIYMSVCVSLCIHQKSSKYEYIIYGVLPQSKWPQTLTRIPLLGSKKVPKPPPPIPTQDASYHNHYETLFSTGIRGVQLEKSLPNQWILAFFSRHNRNISKPQQKNSGRALSTVCCSWASKDLTNRVSAFWRESESNSSTFSAA